jgi:16S rRNA (cytosine967-C5)-methyltransferase
LPATEPRRDDPISASLLRILANWEKSRHTLDYLLERELKAGDLQPAQRARITDGASNWGRGRGSAKYLLSKTLRKNPEKLPRDARLLLELAVSRILSEERTPKEIITSQTVTEIRRQFGPDLGATANAVLRAICSEPPSWPDAEANPIDFLAVSTSHPEWIIERWLNRWGLERTLELTRWNNQRPSLWLRVNLLRGDATWGEQKLNTARIEFEARAEFAGYFRLKSPFYPDAAKLIDEGDFSIQDPSASLTVRLLDPRPGMKILDLCAAPGGKTALLAELCANEAVIVAVDRSPSRLKKIEAALNKLGIGGVALVAGDGREFDPANRSFGLFDAVLVDAPCSGFGVLSRRADLRWRRRPEDLPDLRVLQGELLQAASRCVRPGGSVVYSTCTIEPEENEQVVHDFLSRNGSFSLDETSFHVPQIFMAGPGQVATFSPRDGVDGIYGARLIRPN